MAVTDAYATKDEYKAVILKADALDDTAITDELAGQSRFLDLRMGRHFNRDEAVVPKIYYPQGHHSGNPEAENPWLYSKGSNELVVDDIASKTGLVIKIDDNRDGSFAGETALATTDYELWPLNADKGAEARPWRKIRLLRSGTRGWWPCGSAVEVNAIGGWPVATPKAISRATIYLAAIRRLEGPYAELGDQDKAVEDLIANLARAYKRNRIFA